MVAHLDAHVSARVCARARVDATTTARESRWSSRRGRERGARRGVDVDMTRATVDSTTTRRHGARDFAYSLAGQNPHAAPLKDDARGVVPMELLRVDANAFEEASLRDGRLERAMTFLKTPYRRLTLENPGERVVTATRASRGTMSNRDVVGAPNRSEPARTMTLRAEAAAAEREALTFDDDDEDMMADIDVDAVVMHKRTMSAGGAVTNSVIAPSVPAGVGMGDVVSRRPPARSAARASVPNHAVGCKAPPLDGSGADWTCEHGHSLRTCPHRIGHVQSLKPILANIVFQLEDDDAAVKNSDRKVLIHQRVEAETIIRVCENVTENIQPAVPPSTTHQAQDFNRPVVNAPQQFQAEARYEPPPSINAWTGPLPAAEDFPEMNEELEIGEEVVIPMNGIGAVNVSESIAPIECQMKGGDAKDWGHTNFAWSKLCEQTLRDTFNAKSFRSLQLLAVNATMAARDCLVLMPTGGGKSLCYQLPAVVKPGITVVISPLISLIQDQLHHLSEMGIPATVLSAAKESDNTIYDDLRSPVPDLRLLYVTPEKVVRSGKLKSTLERLYSRGMLNRFVLDEAHCISAWGHDFRKDYTELRGLKHLFPTTPIMCLTATATRRVQDDIVRQLNLPKCLRFFDTFNRINLTYEVHPKLKAKQMILKIKDLIVERGLMRNGKVQCGIIYCFSQNDCERVANELNKIDRAAGDHKRFGVGRKRALRAVPYHAGLTDKVRRENQEAWQSDRAQIICATVAFGMGINKPNVRFVFHHSMPKSLEAYHQESGRAGRDGAHALCILFYTWGDASKARSMLIDSARKERPHPAVLQNNLESLNTMVTYCENVADCRRTQLMAHFDEKFDRSRCRGMCDSCQAVAAGVKFEPVDLTNYAMGMINIVRSVPDGIGIGLLVDVFRGSGAKTVKQKHYDRLPGYGAGKGLDKSESERLARAMVLRNFFSEKSVRSENMGPYATTVTTIHYNGGRCEAIQQGREKFMLSRSSGSKRASTRKAPIPTTVVLDSISTPTGMASQDVTEFLDDALNPANLQSNREDGHVKEQVYSALNVWRRRLARELQINIDSAFPPGLVTILANKRPRNAEEMKEMSNAITQASWRTSLKKHANPIITVINHTLECEEKGIPNEYLAQENQEEDIDDIDDTEAFEALDNHDNRRMSQRLSQQPRAQDSINISSLDPSPAWKKARRM